MKGGIIKVSEVNNKEEKLEEEILEEDKKTDIDDTEDIVDGEVTEASEDEDDTENTEKTKKGFFGKEKKKDKKDIQIDELTDKYKRTMAEFDNFRKRTEKEKSAMYEVGARDVIEKILPVVDNFERGLKTVAEEEKDNPFVDGMDKIYKQLIKTLEDMDVKPIEALDKEFDPAFHNAVMHVDDENVGENVIVEEFQKGYMYRNTVVRHSMVKVAN